jgi:para-nitrobenzyl esterase
VGDGYRALAGDDEAAILLMVSDALHRLPARWTARAHARAGSAVWMGELVWRSPHLGACHGLDVPLVLGTLGARPAVRMLGAPPPAEAVALGAAMRRAWVRFAEVGDPGWPAHDLAAGTTRLWDTEPADVPDPFAASEDVRRGGRPRGRP